MHSQALLLNTLSKLTFADSSRFNVLVDDVFTDVKKGTAQVCDFYSFFVIMDILKFFIGQLC